MEEALLKAKGVNGQVELLQDKVLIRREGLLAKGMGADKEIPLRQIASVKFEDRWNNGYIQFVLGEQDAVSTFKEAQRNPTAVVFNRFQRKPFEALQQAVDRLVAEREGPVEVPDAPVPQRPRKLEFEVKGKPDVILTMVRGFFESDEWPYPVTQNLLESITFPKRGTFNIYGPGGLLMGGKKVSAVLPRHKMMDNPLGCLGIMALSLLTASLFFWVYAVWVFLFRPLVEARVDVTAVPIGLDRTKVTVEGGNPAYTEPVEAWVRRELLEKEAAGGLEEASPNPPTTAGDLLGRVREQFAPQQFASGSDIPDQIRKLAELRDARAITDEEYEAKKRDLLDRM